MRIRDMNWMMVEDYLKRDDRAVIPRGQHGAARAAQPDGGLHPLGEGQCRRRRAAGRSGLSDRAFRGHALFPGLSGHHFDAAADLPRGYRGHAELPQGTGLQAYRAGQWPWRQRLGAAAGARVDDQQSRHAGQVPQLVQRAEDLGQGEGNRSRRIPRLVDGEFPLDAPPGREGAESAEADDLLRANAPLQCAGSPRAAWRRQFRRLLREVRRRHECAVGRRRRGDPRAASKAPSGNEQTIPS